MKRRRALTISALAGLALGCGSTTGPKASAGNPAAAAPTRPAIPAGGCARVATSPMFTPLGEARQGSTIALTRFGERTVAFVADEDARALVTFDVDARTVLATTPLDGAPSQLLPTRDGRVVVALRDAGRLAVLEPSSIDAPLTARCAVETATEPVALAMTADGATLLVTSGLGHRLEARDPGSLTLRFEADLPREPRAVLASDDGKTAFVAHAVGGLLSSIDLDRANHPVKSIAMRRPTDPNDPFSERRTSCQGYALASATTLNGRLLAPQVVVDPGNLEERPNGYGDEGMPTEQAGIAVLDMVRAQAVDRSLAPQRSPGEDPEASAPECLLPRAAAVDPESRTLFVTCFGIDTVIAYDALAATPARTEIKRWSVPGGPSGVGVDPAHGRLVVWSQFERALSVLPFPTAQVEPPAKPGAVAARTLVLGPFAQTGMDYQRILGRTLFHAGNDPRVSGDGRACASCHPDGRDDAITWATPNGPRRTLMLAGRVADTAPYGWDGDGHDLEEHVQHTFERLRGTGLKTMELRALLTYVQSLSVPTLRHAPADDAAVTRGSAIFHSPTAGCATCHEGPAKGAAAALGDGRAHDIGSATKLDRQKAFDTPSLHLVASHAPYFHDGRYPSLRALLRSNETMGSVRHLDEPDLQALEAYLGSL